jgi:4-hydroxy-2-oxoheptanedioate aldolase
MAKMTRATGFGKFANEYINNLDENILGVIQIETAKALHNIAAIAATEGIDVLFVGPTDLSLSLGIPGQLQHSLYQEAILAIAKAAKNSGKAVGVLLQDLSEYDMYYRLGYRFLACGSDGMFVRRGAEEMVKGLRSGLRFEV